MDRRDIKVWRIFFYIGGAYARAIELARNVSPDEVTNLEEEWGDW